MEIPKTQMLNLSQSERFCLGLKMIADECELERIEYNMLGVQTLHFADGSSVGGLRIYFDAGLLKEI